MITLRVFFFAVLAVKNFKCVQTDDYQSPVTFYYQDAVNLNLGIILQNVPPEAESYIIYYQTENCDINRPEVPCSGVPAKNGMIPTDGFIYIKMGLNKASVRVYIELGKYTTKLCSTKTILVGVRDPAVSVYTPFFRSYEYCNITVDFDHKCDGPPPVRTECTQFNGHIRCEAPVEELPKNTIHQWYQCDNEYLFIGAIPPVTGSRSTFILKPQKFDVNTTMYTSMSSTSWNNNSTIRNHETFLPITGYEGYDIRTYYYYTEPEPVKFICQNKANTQIGLIDPTGCHISTRNTTTHSKYFDKKDNNSMLCCLHYNILKYNDYTNIERSVENITLLVYREPLQSENDNIATTTDLIFFTLRHPTSMATTEENLVNNNQMESQTQEPISRAEVATEEPDPGTDKSKYYIGIASVAGIVILLLLIYVLIKKLRRKSSDRDQILQLETYASTNMVLYADLDTQPTAAQGPSHTDDATYAEIIGVLMPAAGNAKKS